MATLGLRVTFSFLLLFFRGGGVGVAKPCLVRIFVFFSLVLNVLDTVLAVLICSFNLFASCLVFF